IRTLEFVESDRIDVLGKKEDVSSRQVPVSVANPKAAVFNTVVDVFVRIGEKRVERTFKLIVPGVPAKTATFTLYGPKTLLIKTRPDGFKLERDPENSDALPRLIVPAELQDVVEVRNLTVR
ncbi:MAG: hypothetical protein ABIV21_06230, partial [Pyrinomonadaceae bacterium]